MVIDMHAFPGFFEEICEDPKKIAFRREQYFLYKQHVWPLSLFMTQLDAAGINKAVISGEDVTTRAGGVIVSNEEVKSLVDRYPDRLIGFAGVDPRRPDALEVLERAFTELGMKGLKLSPAMQYFMPGDPIMKPVYELCLKYDKPILFEAGMTWVKNSPSRYSNPLNFEEVAIEYPKLRMCLGHFGWPWTRETAMLILKYPNLYADTALLYFDSPKQFFETTFHDQLGEYWIDRMLYDKVLFGSTYPRIEQKRMVKAMEVLNLRPRQRAMVMGENACRFMGMEV
ncbi:MAG: amidohydrolase [Lachnospiraceae bacterium]|jgi:predicted TIM-barrel fold metal-dependent hydrolase|nr:amidohydrolase [Lachnospiraceae bacterium]